MISNVRKERSTYALMEADGLYDNQFLFFYFYFLAFAFCRFCVVIRFFHPRHNGQWPPTSKDFYPRFYPLHYFPILILEKEPVFPFSMLSAKQGNYWYHFYIQNTLIQCIWVSHKRLTFYSDHFCLVPRVILLEALNFWI